MNRFQLMPPHAAIASRARRVGLIASLWLAVSCVFAQAPKDVAKESPKANPPSQPIPQWGEPAINAFLTAELLALDQQFEAAANTLWPLARYLKQAQLYERVVQWAMQAKRMDLAFSAASQWEALEPNATKPQQLSDGILILAERYGQFGARIATRYGKALGAPNELELQYLQRLGRGLSLTPAQNAALYNAIHDALKPHWALAGVQYTLAVLANQAKLSKESAEHLRAASLAMPASPAAIGALLQDEPAQATLSALHWSVRDPKNIDSWRTLGLVYAQLKQPTQAADAFAQGLKLAPKDVPLLLERMDQLRLAGQPQAARDSLLAAYAVRASITQAVPARLLAEQLEDDYHTDKALETYALALSLSTEPDDKTWLQARIWALKAAHGDAASMTALLALQAKSEEPSKATFTRMAGAALREQGQFVTALALAQSLPEDEAAYEQALSYEHMGQAVKSEALLRGALSREPNAAHLLNTLGYGLVDRNTSPAALAEGTLLLEQAFAAKPDSAAIMDSLGWAYFRAKDYARAKPLLQNAYDLKRDPEIAAHLGELLHVTGNAAQARKIWAQSLAIDPKHKVVLSTLKRLNIKLATP